MLIFALKSCKLLNEQPFTQKKKNMKTIGFTNKYYTLWEVSEPYKVHVNAFQWYEKQDFTYLKNLSKTLEGAKSKLQGDFVVNLELRGNSSFTRSSDLVDGFENWQFTFGKLMGADIRTCDDIWQLNRAMNNEKGDERRDLAKQRLVELGEIVEFDGEFISKTQLDCYQELKRKRELKAGHFYSDGEKVELVVKVEESFSFKTQFGTCFVETYSDTENRLFKYKGANPPYFCINGDYDPNVFFRINATVKHSEYDGQAETLIQRIKVISKK